MKKITLVTRQSPLALWQAEFVKSELEYHHSDLRVELLGITTQGDRFLETPLQQIGGKGLFVKELEQAILDDRADIAVHSLKDVPFALPADLTLGAICARENPCDAFVSYQYQNFQELPPHAHIGTSSLRRACQLKLIRPDVRISPLRGNIATRLKKLEEGCFDAVILAYAGLVRLNLQEKVKEIFSPHIMIPAIGQGALAIECRTHDKTMRDLLTPLNHHETQLCVSAERSFNFRLQGGCHTAIAAYAEKHGNVINLQGFVGHPEENTYLRSSVTGSATDAISLGEQLAEQLLKQGANNFLAILNDLQNTST